MAIAVHIVGSAGRHADVTPSGELVVGSPAFSTPYTAEVNGTAITNIVTPKTNNCFVITAIIIGQDRTNTDSKVNIYESNSVDGTASREILTIDVAKSQVVPLTGLNMTTEKNKWINFTSDSGTSTIRVTIMGYYTSA